MQTIDLNNVIDADFTPIEETSATASEGYLESIGIEFPESEDSTESRSFPDEHLDELVAARKQKISEMARYCGEIASKSSLRKLPTLRVGDIYWITNDNAAVIVSEKAKGKVGLKPLNEEATVSTGYTIYEMNKALISKEPIFDFTDVEANEALMLDLKKYFSEDTSDTFYLMHCRENGYFTILQCEDHTNPDIGCIIECIGNAGRLISIDRDSEIGDFEALEIWIRTDKSKAELFYLFPFDAAVAKM